MTRYGYDEWVALALQAQRAGDLPLAVRASGEAGAILAAGGRATAAGAEFFARFALLLVDADQPRLARERLAIARRILERVTSPVATGTVRAASGRLAFFANHRQAAHDHLVAAADHYLKLGNPASAADCLLTLAEFRVRDGLIDHARILRRQAEDVFDNVPVPVDCAWRLSLLAADLDPESATAELDVANTLAAASGDAIALARTSARIARERALRGHAADAEADARAAWTALRQRSSAEAIDAGLDCAQILVANEKPAAAADVIDECLRLVEMRRAQLEASERFSLMERYSMVAQWAAGLRVDQGDTESAFAASERGQGCAALGSMFDRQLRRQGGRRILVAPGGCLSLEGATAADTTRDLAAAGVDLVKFMFADSRLHGWWQPPGGPIEYFDATAAIRVIDEAAAHVLAANLPAGSGTWEIPPYRAPWPRLSSALRELAERGLPSALLKRLDDRRGRLGIVAHRNLFWLPWSALPGGDGRPLGERWEVTVVPSAGALLQLDPRRDPGAGGTPLPFLGIGDSGVQRVRVPITPGADEFLIDVQFGELASTRAELAHARSCCGGMLLTGEAATCEAVLRALPDATIVHFATHGYWSPAGDTSLLVLGGQAPGNWLPQEALDAVKLRAEAVVLSACQTGLGLPHPDSHTGLAQAFLMAGARCVLSTLWPVGDAATETLMRAWYGALAAGATPAAALQSAQAELRADPARVGWDWAGFQFWGWPFHAPGSSIADPFPGPVFRGDCVQVLGERPGTPLDLDALSEIVGSDHETLRLRPRS